MMNLDGIFGCQRRVVEETKAVRFIAFRVVPRWPDDSYSTTTLTAQNTFNNLERRAG
jgi:hypothetical protein